MLLTPRIPPPATPGASHEDAALHPHPLELHPASRPLLGPGRPPRSATVAAATRPLGASRPFPPAPPPLCLPWPSPLVPPTSRLAASQPPPPLGSPALRHPPVVPEKHADSTLSAAKGGTDSHPTPEATTFGDNAASLPSFPRPRHTGPASEPGEHPRSSSPAPTGARTICRSKT